jgi:predicted sulfurtransferase
MKPTDFKKSKGSKAVFPNGLKVGVHEEVVPMGISPIDVSYKDAGKLLSPEEFHEALSHYIESDGDDKNSTVFVDCRNFYESNIGKFVGAVTPDIRKFSYWPEYVKANKDYYADKKIYMYCTGGIRCERGSAFFKHMGLGKEVYQLSGGIHKYLEKYPDGYFRGKLFVFDDRYSIQSNDDVISECKYCRKPWDSYSPCSSSHCHQLVLSCSECKENGQTACCCECKAHSGDKREECECTRNRARVPVHTTQREREEPSCNS